MSRAVEAFDRAATTGMSQATQSSWTIGILNHDLPNAISALGNLTECFIKAFTYYAGQIERVLPAVRHHSFNVRPGSRFWHNATLRNVKACYSIVGI